MDTATKTRTCRDCNVDVPVADGGTLIPHTREHKLLGEVHCVGSGKSHLPECEVVDQIVSWTDGTSRLNIVVGDLVVHDDRFEEVAEVHYDPVRNMRVNVGFKGRNSLVFKDPAAPVAVRRYVETTEE